VGWQNVGGQLSPCLFHETVNSERYVRLILSPFFSQMTDEKLYGHFMKDNATARTVKNSVVALDGVFGERAIRI
jgi:hypothetical protein